MAPTRMTAARKRRGTLGGLFACAAVIAPLAAVGTPVHAAMRQCVTAVGLSDPDPSSCAFDASSSTGTVVAAAHHWTLTDTSAEGGGAFHEGGSGRTDVTDLVAGHQYTLRVDSTGGVPEGVAYFQSPSAQTP